MKTVIQNVLRVSMILALLLVFSDPALAKRKNKKNKGKLKAVAVQEVGDVTCVQTKKGKWFAAKKKRNKYRKNKNKAAKAACNTLNESGVTAVSSFSNLPNFGDILTDTATAAFRSFDTSAAPTLGTLAQASKSESGENHASKYFYPDGVLVAALEENPTEEACNNYREATAGCYMTRGVGDSMGGVLSAGNAMCYMKHMPEVKGAVKIIKGTGSAKNIFTTTEKTKIIKIRMVEPEQQSADGPEGQGPGEGPQEGQGPGEGEGPGEGGHEEHRGPQDIYIRIASLSENQESGDHYNAQLVFCVDEETEGGEGEVDSQATKTIEGFEIVRATKEGQLIVTSEHGSRGEGEGSGSSTLTAALKKLEDGSFDFDKTQPKVMSYNFTETRTRDDREGGEEEHNEGPEQEDSNQTPITETFSFKANITVTPDGELTMKMQDQFSNSAGIEGHKGNRYVVAAIEQGEVLADLRMPAGAVKEQFLVNDEEVDNFTVGISWNGTIYAKDTESSLLEDVDVDFSDSFYDATSDVASEGAPFGCDVTPTHIVRLNTEHKNFGAVEELCERNQLDVDNFCETANANEHDIRDNCSPEPGEGEEEEGDDE